MLLNITIHIVFNIIQFFSRGPNKYTRNWEDEDAYGKTTPGRGNTRRFHKNNEDFPALSNNKVNLTKFMIFININDSSLLNIFLLFFL